ncbi:MAG: hypothetical protein HGA54_03915 [Actinobacteria bacterium]|nr:hypothetical protein [Actinomycetota bacterium]
MSRILDGDLLRDMHHLHMILSRHARDHGGCGRDAALGILLGHEEAVAQGLCSKKLTQKELSQMLGITAQSVGTLLFGLEEDGMITRISPDDDHRRFYIELTPTGRENALIVDRKRKIFAKEILGVLSEQEKEDLSHIIRKLNASLDQSRR